MFLIGHIQPHRRNGKKREKEEHEKGRPGLKQVAIWSITNPSEFNFDCYDEEVYGFMAKTKM